MHSSVLRTSAERPVRVKLGGTVLALLRLQNGRQVRAKLHQISVTGGVLHAEKPLDEGISVEIIFHLCSTTVRCQARALFPLWATQGYLQPFEFRNLSESDRSQLQAEIEGLVKSLSATVVPSSMPWVEAAANDAPSLEMPSVEMPSVEMPSVEMTAEPAPPAETTLESDSSAPVS